MNDAAVIAIIRHALRALSERVLTIVALLMTFGLTAWAMHQPSWERDGMAAFFAVFVFLPCLLHDKRRMTSEAPKIQAGHDAQAG